jgi:hypothetical protein
MWPLKLRREHKLRILEQNMLRKTFGPKTEKLVSQWKKTAERSGPAFLLLIKYYSVATRK